MSEVKKLYGLMERSGFNGTNSEPLFWGPYESVDEARDAFADGLISRNEYDDEVDFNTVESPLCIVEVTPILNIGQSITMDPIVSAPAKKKASKEASVSNKFDF